MSSRWNEYDIDWSNLHSQRLDVIVREVYFAVSERNYYIEYVQGNHLYTPYQEDTYIIPPIDKEGRVRMETQIKYIYDTLKAWLIPTAKLSQIASGDELLTNYAVFINKNKPLPPQDFLVPPTNPNSFEDGSSIYCYTPFYGWDHYDYSEDGDFENDFDLDLEFLRNDWYEMVYKMKWVYQVKKLLDLDLHTSMRIRRFQSDIDSTTGIRFLMRLHPLIGEDGVGEARYGFSWRRTGGEYSETDINNSYSNDTSRSAPLSRYPNDLHHQEYKNNRYDFNPEGFQYAYDKARYKYVIQGVDTLINAKDMDLINRSYFRSVYDRMRYWDDVTKEYIYASTEMSPFTNMEYGHVNSDFNFEEVTDSEISDVWSFIETPPKGGEFFYIGDFPQSLDTYKNQLLSDFMSYDVIQEASFGAFVNINKEGFLNYYTEEAN